MYGLTRALGLYARILGRKLGVNVEFKRVGTAATDSKTVYIDPAFNSIGTESAATTVFGLIGHECMHLRLTDFPALKRFMELQGKKKANAAILKHLQNVIEDVWGEREFCQSLPSVWVDICGSMVEMRKADLYGPPKPPKDGKPSHPAAVFVNWFLAQNLGRHYTSLPDFAKDASHWQSHGRSILGDEVINKALALIPLVDQVTSTQEACDLALRVYQVIEQTAKEEQQKQQSQQGSGKAQVDSSEKDEKGGQKPSPGSQSQEPSRGGPGQGGQARPAGATAEQGVIDQLLNATAQDMQACNSEKGDALKGKSEFDAKNGSLPGWVDQLETTGRTVCQVTEAQLLLQNRLRGLLGGRLERLLQANADISHEYRRRGTRIANSRLTLVKSGVLDVFSRTDLGEDLDTVVEVLVDASGSMRSIWDQTLCACYAVVDELARFEVPVGISQFGCRFQTIHSSDKPWRRESTDRPLMVGGGTPTEKALMRIANGLVLGPHKCKIIMVITDGVPGNCQSAVAIAGEIQGAGIDVVHIFIGRDSEKYASLLRDARIGSQARCVDENDSQALANAIESALVDAFTKHLRQAA